MHQLADVVSLFTKVGIECREFYGWYFITDHGIWTMYSDTYFLNKEEITREKIKEIAENFKKTVDK